MPEKPLKLLLTGNKAKAGKFLPFARAKLAEAQSIYGYPFERRYTIGTEVTIVVSGDEAENRTVRIHASGGLFGYEFLTGRRIFGGPHLYSYYWEGQPTTVENLGDDGVAYKQFQYGGHGPVTTPNGGPFARYSLVRYSAPAAGLIVTDGKKNPISGSGESVGFFSGATPLFMDPDDVRASYSAWWSMADDSALLLKKTGSKYQADYYAYLWAALPPEWQYDERYFHLKELDDGVTYFYDEPVVTTAPARATVYDLASALRGAKLKPGADTVSGAGKYGGIYILADDSGTSRQFTICDKNGFTGASGGQSITVTLPEPPWKPTAIANTIGRSVQPVKCSWHFSPHAMRAVAVYSYWAPIQKIDADTLTEWQSNDLGGEPDPYPYDAFKLELRQGIYEVVFEAGVTEAGVLWGSASAGRQIESDTGMLVAVDYDRAVPGRLRALRVGIYEPSVGFGELGRPRDCDWEWFAIDGSAFGSPYRVVPQYRRTVEDASYIYTPDDPSTDSGGGTISNVAEGFHEGVIHALDLATDSFAMTRISVEEQLRTELWIGTLYGYNVESGWVLYVSDGKISTSPVLDQKPVKVAARRLLVVNGATIADEAIDTPSKTWKTTALQDPPTTDPMEAIQTTLPLTPQFTVGWTPGAAMPSAGSTGAPVRASVIQRHGFASLGSYLIDYFVDDATPAWACMPFLWGGRPNASWIEVHPDGHWSTYCAEAKRQVRMLTIGQTTVYRLQRGSLIFKPAFGAWEGWDMLHNYLFEYRHVWTGEDGYLPGGKEGEPSDSFPFVQDTEIDALFDVVFWNEASGAIQTSHKDLLAASRPGARLRTYETPYAFAGVWVIPRAT